MSKGDLRYIYWDDSNERPVDYDQSLSLTSRRNIPTDLGIFTIIAYRMRSVN